MRYYQHVCGWFDFPDVYIEAINKAKDGDILVEIGSFLGKSACFMAEEILKSNKKLQFNCIDVWEMTKNDEFKEDHVMPWGEKILEYMDRCGKDALYWQFQSNIKFAPGGHIIKPIREYSWEAAKYFQDKSCHFIFIDAGHSYEAVSKDLEAWYPKIKPNGIFAGHDIIGEDVQKALKEFCNKYDIKQVYQRNASWLIYT